MTTSNSTSSDASHGTSLSGGVIAGLAVVGGIVGIALVFLLFGFYRQRQARRGSAGSWLHKTGGIGVSWTNLSYFVPTSYGKLGLRRKGSSDGDVKTVLYDVSGQVAPGQMMAILGPSGK